MDETDTIPTRPGVRLWRHAKTTGAAGVWLHQGLWCKVLGRDPDHQAVIASVPGVRDRAAAATALVGVAETALALLVATRGDRRWVAALQTATVGAFNAGGLVMGRAHIDHPARLLVRNGAFVALIWSAVDGHRPR